MNADLVEIDRVDRPIKICVSHEGAQDVFHEVFPVETINGTRIIHIVGTDAPAAVNSCVEYVDIKAVDDSVPAQIPGDAREANGAGRRCHRGPRAGAVSKTRRKCSVEGRTVTKGDVIGTVGGSETPEGPHLEFQVRNLVGGGAPQAIDPQIWLRERGPG